MDFIRKFDIELDKEIYYAGEILSGKIIVQNTENIRVQGIRLHIRGKAHAEWRITRAGERRHVKQDEHYIDERKSIWGKDKNEEGPIPILPRGNHKYPFEFKLPESALPCSFESKIGTIRYYIRVTIDIPYASCPQGIKYFTVVGPHTDCMDERFLTPSHAESKRYNCILCCGKGPLSLKGTLERTAYCCGENVKLKVEIQNGCDEEVWLVCRMMQYVEYFINRGVLGLSKELRHTVMQVESPHIEPHTTTSLDDLWHQLQVPIMPPTMVDVCGLVQIYYTLRLCLRMEKSGDALEVEMPVTIATVPFRIPSNPIPEIQYDVAADYVEGGMYISSEFQLGQVYMGDDEDSDTDKEILYRPVYVCVPHKRPTPRHKTRSSDINRSTSPNSTDALLPESAETPKVATPDESSIRDNDVQVQLDKSPVSIKIVRDTENTRPKDDDLKNKEELPTTAKDERKDSQKDAVPIPIVKEYCVQQVETSDGFKSKDDSLPIVKESDADVIDNIVSNDKSAKESANKGPTNVPIITMSAPVTLDNTSATKVKQDTSTAVSKGDGTVSTTKCKTTFREVHETSSALLVKTVETVKVKNIVVSTNETEEREFKITKSEHSHSDVSSQRAQGVPSTVEEKIERV
ncbi:uncharacterized protein LOC124135614 [Haliotis rufescens]|uniref:uncharacterized protein LOC124135614 n=1 Tax=Haliotis rufescens TaxID=6454 RepID=UPI001EAFFE00|nr:uncharacterized protein LOC124135614 [Haliotis rufescens]